MSRNLSPPELLDDLYLAIEDHSHWSQFLQGLTTLFNGNSATLRLAEIHTPQLYRSYVYGYTPVLDHQYQSHLIAHDPFRDYLSRADLRLHQSRDALSDREFQRTELYQKMFRPRGNFYTAGGHILRDQGRAWQIGVQRSRAAGPFDAAEMKRLEYFVPHLRRAVRLMETIDQSQQALELARGALNEASFGIWLLDARGRCQWMNRVADTAVRERSHGLTLARGLLSHATPRTARMLRRAQSAALSATPRSSQVVIGTRGCGVLVTPLTPSFSLLSEQSGAMLLLLDPQRPRPLDQSMLQGLYALTPAEARLTAALAAGKTLQDVSGECGISLHTARSQLKAVMRKTDTNRQTDLIRTVLLGPALPP